VPKPLQQSVITAALVRALGLKGKFGLELDETAVVTVQGLDLEFTPYQRQFVACGEGLIQQPVVAENSYVGVQASTGVILAIDGLHLSAGAGIEMSLQRLTAANLVTIGAPGAISPMKSFDGNDPPAATGPRVTSTIFRNSFAGAVGDRVALWAVSTADISIPFPNPYILRGDDPAGLNALAVVGLTVNQAVRASFFCREFPFPG